MAALGGEDVEGGKDVKGVEDVTWGADWRLRTRQSRETARLIAERSATLVEDGKDVEGVEDAGPCWKSGQPSVRGLTASGSPE